MTGRGIQAVAVSALCLFAFASESRAADRAQHPNQLSATVTPPTATITRRAITIVPPSATINGRPVTIQSLSPQEKKTRSAAKKEFAMEIVRAENPDLRTLETFRKWQAARRANRRN